MYEELSKDEEILVPTSDDKISIVESKNPTKKR